MGTDSDGQSLINDPAREAAASMRGYWAQVWRSVLVWMDLGETERLYLEGAEDIDRIDGFAAETVQVKDVTGNVTLRSSDVVDAIGNALAHQERNPKHTVKFRFLTKSGIGVEQGAPFGAGIGGLRLWNDSRQLDDEAEQERTARMIADFLLAEAKISTQVQTILRMAPDGKIWKRMIASIEWDTDAEEVPEVIRDIRDRLVVLGEKTGVTPDKAADVAEHLYTTAYATATRQKDRYLTRADLLRLFHERTQISMSAATANALLAVIPQHLVPAGPLPKAIGGKTGLIGRPPPVPARYYARQAVLAEITTRLSTYPVLALQGGTGVGKSIAAAGHSAISTSSWGWVDLRGAQVGTLAELLGRVAGELAVEDGLRHLVLDDIELPADARALEAPIARIAAILAQRGGQMVITSAVALPQRLALALALPATGTMSIPAFSREEITEFLVARGCPGAPVAGWWAAFVEMHTSGHAQLVHARIATLEAQGFPTPDMQSVMVTPSDVVEARAEARRLITTLAPAARELIYRLSITVQALPQRQVFAIAGQPPPIAEPGLTLDGLVGPWLEIVAEGLYRVSPLLRGVGPEVQGEAWATAMHSSIAGTILGFRTLSPTDVSTILFHATAARDWSAVTHLSFGILASDNETWEALAQTASWFVLVGTGGATRPEIDVFSLFLLRLLQFRLAAAALDQQGVASVIACMDEELPATVEGVPLRLARHIFLAQVLLRTEVTLPISQIVVMSLEYMHLSDVLKDTLAHAREVDLDHALAGPDGIPNLAGVAGFCLTSRLTDRESLAALVVACGSAESTSVRSLLWFIGGEESTARLVFDRAWLAEMKAPTPDWLTCRSIFEQTYELARRCGLPGLAQGAARAIVRLTDENLRSPAEALRLADAMTAEIGPSPGQDDQRAATLLGRGDTAEALTIWRELLPSWRPRDEFDLQQTFSHRLAAIAAGRLGEWTEAADWLRSARSFADEDTQPTYHAGLFVDEGFARWKGGDDLGTLACLIEGLTAIDRLPADDVDESAYFLRKRAGHTIMWIASTTARTPPKEFTEPPPACCSNHDPVTEARVPSTPSDAMWVHALEFEFHAELGDTQFRTWESRLKTSPYGLMRFTFDRLRLEHRLRSLALGDFVEVIGDWANSFALVRRYYRENGLGAADPLPDDAATRECDQDDAELILTGMLNAVFALAARGAVTRIMLDQWSLSAARTGLSSIVDPWLTFLAGLFVDNSINAESEVRNTSRAWQWRASASIRVAIDRMTRPAELLTIHNYWTNALPKMVAVLFVLTDVEHLVTGAWLRLAENRFLLHSPTLTVPALELACAGNNTGWSKIGAVLLAACDAVPGAVPAEFREKFKKMRSSQ